MPEDNTSHLRSLIFEQIPDAVIGLNSRDEICDFNQEAGKFFAIPDGQFRSRKITDLFPGGIPNNHLQRFEVEAKRSNGELFPAEVTLAAIQDGAEKYRYLIIRNITLRKKISNELQLFTESVENSLNAFDIVNSEGKFIYVNKAYVKMWGYNSAEEIIGTSVAKHCADPQVPQKIISSLKATGECNIEFDGLRKDGSIFNVLMWARLAHDPDGNAIYPTTSIDITDRVEAANEKLRLQAQLEMAIKARDEFINICSHELKTPITSLKLQFQLSERQIKKKNPDFMTEESVMKRIDQTNRQLDRMSVLIDDMLDVAKISSGKFTMIMERLDFHDLVAEVMERLDEHFTNSQVPVTFKSTQHKFYVYCDRFRMEQVIQNLLTNALKYGGGKEVKVSLSSANGKIIFQVKDQGIGIAPQNMNKIFDRYERAIEASEISGLGLGLYISRQLVDLHNGAIFVTSELGKGSTFVVEIPESK